MQSVTLFVLLLDASAWAARSRALLRHAAVSLQGNSTGQLQFDRHREPVGCASWCLEIQPVEDMCAITGVCDACPGCPKKEKASTVVVRIHTCDVGWAGSKGKMQVQFPGGAVWAPLTASEGNPQTRNKWETHNISAGMESPTSIAFRTTSSDGWCIDQVEVGGKQACIVGPSWLDSPCEAPAAYHGAPCQADYVWALDGPCTTTTTTTTQLTVEVKVHTCDVPYSGTDGRIDLQFPGQTTWREIDTPNHNDFVRDKWDTFNVSAGDKAPTSISLRSSTSDGWCVDRIQVDGKEGCLVDPQWLDKPCTATAYRGVPCAGERVWTLDGPCTTTTTTTTLLMVKVEVHTCDVGYAGSGGNIEVQFPGDSTSAGFPSKMARNKWNSRDVAVAAMPTSITLRSGSSDGWCVDEIKVNGKAACSPGKAPIQWLDVPCEAPATYHGVACASSRSWSLQCS